MLGGDVVKAAMSEEAMSGAMSLIKTPRGQIVSALVLVILTWAVVTRRVLIVCFRNDEKKKDESSKTPARAALARAPSRRPSDRRRGWDRGTSDDEKTPGGREGQLRRPKSLKNSEELHIAAGEPTYGPDGRLLSRKGAYWLEPDPDFKVRSESYLMDKVKCSCGKPVFRLMDCDLLELEVATPHVSQYLMKRIEGLTQKHPDVKDPYVMVVQLQVPGPPYKTFCMYFLAERFKVFSDKTPFSNVARKFFARVDSPEGPDGGADFATNAALHKFRNNTFKLIPRCVNGPFVVKRAVGEVPTLLGNKLQQCYYAPSHGKYFELFINISSSRIAQYTLGLAINYASVVVADMALVLQGTTVEQLPECLMGVCRIEHINMRDAAYLEIDNDNDTEKQQ